MPPRNKEFDGHLNVSATNEMIVDLRRIANRRRVPLAELVRGSVAALIEGDEIARLKDENEALRKALEVK